jgi:hypothetical protein
MSHPVAAARARGVPAASSAWAVPDARRRLQLVLAGLWLLDAVLQYQSFMFTRGFSRELAAAAPGSPVFVAGPVRWSASLVAGHLTLANAAFATLQLLIGLGIAWRPAARLMLGVSVGWALAIWWLGEGLGLLLTGTASPVNGAPGAALLYAVAAVLLWPVPAGPAARGPAPASPAPAGRTASGRTASGRTASGRTASGRTAAGYPAGGAIGDLPARAVWVLVWGGLAVLALQPAARAPGAVSAMIAEMADGQPAWLAGTDRHLASALSQRGLAVSVILAVLLAVVAALGCLRARSATRAAVSLGAALAAVIWVGEGLGGMFSGMATDPNTGPLLALIALAYWPSRPGPQREAQLEPGHQLEPGEQR